MTADPVLPPLPFDPAAVAAAAVEAMAAMEERKREERRAKRDRHGMPKAPGAQRGLRRGMVVLPTTPGGWLDGRHAIVLGGHYSYQSRTREWKLWCPASNEVETVPYRAVRAVSARERKAIVRAVVASAKAAAALLDTPGTIYRPVRPILLRRQQGWVVQRYRLTPDDLLIRDPTLIAKTHGDNRNLSYDGDTEPEDYPPRRLAGIKGWEKYAPALIWVYSLRYRDRLLIEATDIVPHEFDPEGLRRVVLPPGYRDLILNCVESAVRGAGAGVNLLLFGPPGVGKTYTARCLAEELRRPLLPVDARDFGAGAIAFEGAIRSALQRVHEWGAVLLIDEADVLLSDRESGVTSAAYTTILLRLLENHGGIVVLTSNRAFTIDRAFESRLNLRLYFSPLGERARREVWRRGLIARGYDLHDGLLDALARCDLDGREVQLAMNNAQSAALRAGRERASFTELRDAAHQLETDAGILRGEGSNPVGFGKAATRRLEEWE